MTLKTYILTSLLLLLPLSAHTAETCVSFLGKNGPIFTNAAEIDWAKWKDGEPVRIKTVMADSLGSQDVTVGRAKFPKMGDGLPYHRHSHPELYKVISGQAKIILDGVVHTATPDQVVILPGNAMHTIINDGDTPLVIEYYFPSNSLYDVGYEYPEDLKNLTSTVAFSPERHKKYVISPDSTRWTETYFEGVATRDLVTEDDNVWLTFSQLRMYSRSQPLEINFKNAQVISVKSGTLNIKFDGKNHELNEGEMVFVPKGSSAIISSASSRTALLLDIVTRDLLQ